uniref:LLM class flavin-dependent oxidoreductase n=1 Tax=Streptomyces sp. JAC128 TaxID=3418412 RepID=UPI003D816443
MATQNTTYNYPADLARRLAGLDLLSEGRAGWNVVTTDNAWTGANLRRGGWLEHERRYERAGQFVEAAKELWSSWAPDAVAPDGRATSWARPGAVTPVERETDLVRLRATATVPGSRQGRPVLFQAGDSDGGREPAARHADVVFSANTEYGKAVAYAADLRERLARHGRSPDSLRILPGASVVLGDTTADAEEKPAGYAVSRSTGRGRSPSSSSTGAPTCPPTTRTDRCPTSNPVSRSSTPRAARSPSNAAPASRH